MNIPVYMIDPSNEDVPRNPERFSRLLEAFLKTDSQEIHLVSGREAKEEYPYLDKIPEKSFEPKKGIYRKIMPEKLRKDHIRVKDFESSLLFDYLCDGLKTPALFFYEDEPEELSCDGTHFILKFMNMYKERGSSILALQRIPFSEIPRHPLLKGTLIAPGEYRIQSAFRAETPLQSSSNLAIKKRFLLKPLFFKHLRKNLNNQIKDPFLETLDFWIKTEPVFGFSPFSPVKIK